MPDVTPRAIDLQHVVRGRIVSISVGDGTDKKWTITGLSPDAAIEVCRETINMLSTELEDLSKLEQKMSRDLEVLLSLSEMDTTDITTINGATIEDLFFVTSEGGANGTGVTFKVDAADMIVAYIDGLKTKVRATKRTAIGTLGYSITDNAA